MKIVLIFLLSLFSSFLTYAQQELQEEEIKEFVFNTFSRGYSKTIEVSPDSVLIREASRRKPGGETEIRRKISEQEWKNMLEAVSDNRPDQLRDLPSPTKNRTFDGARHSNIIIRTNKEEYDSGSFDNENPNRKLAPLMQAFIEIANKSSKGHP